MRTLKDAIILCDRLTKKNKVVYCVYKCKCGSFDICRLSELGNRHSLYTSKIN